MSAQFKILILQEASRRSENRFGGCCAYAFSVHCLHCICIYVEFAGRTWFGIARMREHCFLHCGFVLPHIASFERP